jgi:hypothetical protein
MLLVICVNVCSDVESQVILNFLQFIMELSVFFVELSLYFYASDSVDF